MNRKGSHRLIFFMVVEPTNQSGSNFSTFSFCNILCISFSFCTIKVMLLWRQRGPINLKKWPGIRHSPQKKVQWVFLCLSQTMFFYYLNVFYTFHRHVYTTPLCKWAQKSMLMLHCEPRDSRRLVSVVQVVFYGPLLSDCCKYYPYLSRWQWTVSLPNLPAVVNWPHLGWFRKILISEPLC